MRRNNEDRLMGGHKPTPSEEVPQMPNPMDFVTPTEFVPLPSKGRYPEGHPLCGKDTIEIKYMTAKDEDTLTNRSLLKKGLAIDRVVENLIFDKNIDPKSLYIGDRNSIIIHARASAYGKMYKVTVQCPACTEQSLFSFDLSDYKEYSGDKFEDVEIKDNGDATFSLELPISKIVATIRPLLGGDEADFVTGGENNLITKQMKKYVVSFNGYGDQKTVDYVCENMIATDSKYLRQAYSLISPDIIMEQNFVCEHCSHEEVMSVPFGTDFFWPK